MVGGRTRAWVAVLLCTLVLAGCSPDSPPPTPTPTPSVVTPAETEAERQERLDYEAAEKAYRTFRADFNENLRSGGASRPPEKLSRVAGGGYLKETGQVLQAYKGLGNYQRGNERIVYVRRGGYEPSELVLLACEDTREVRTVDSAGRTLGHGDLRAVSIVVRHSGSGWKLWSGKGKKVTSCD